MDINNKNCPTFPGSLTLYSQVVAVCRLRLKCDGTRAETRFCLSAKRTSPFKSAGASVQSTTGNQGVRISGSNAGYTKFRGNEGYWLPTPFAIFPFTSPPVRHRVPSGFNWTLPPDLTFRKSAFFPLTLYLPVLWITEQTAIISVHSVNRLVIMTET